MKYRQIKFAYFEERVNRFIARCRLVETNEIITVHVKNTGRGKEVLVPEALVAVDYVPSDKRKTSYDLIAVKKQNQWINIDSQVPNTLAAEGVLSHKIKLPELTGDIRLLKREVMFGRSKFDIYLETKTEQQAFIEVKGMTLENQGIGAFPDAPTVRGLKHVEELIEAKQQGFHAYLLFIVQLEQVTVATIHKTMQPLLAIAIRDAQAAGVKVLAYNCRVTPEKIEVKEQIPFEIDAFFKDPNKV